MFCFLIWLLVIKVYSLWAEHQFVCMLYFNKSRLKKVGHLGNLWPSWDCVQKLHECIKTYFSGERIHSFHELLKIVSLPLARGSLYPHLFCPHLASWFFYAAHPQTASLPLPKIFSFSLSSLVFTLHKTSVFPYFPYLAIECALNLLPYLQWTLLWVQPFPCCSFEWKHLTSRLGNGVDILCTPHRPPLLHLWVQSFSPLQFQTFVIAITYCYSFSFKIHFKIWAPGSHPSFPSCFHPAWL